MNCRTRQTPDLCAAATVSRVHGESGLLQAEFAAALSRYEAIQVSKLFKS